MHHESSGAMGCNRNMNNSEAQQARNPIQPPTPMNADLSNSFQTHNAEINHIL